MFRGITDIFALLGQLLPIEVLVPLAGLAILVAIPLWWRSVRVRQIKGALRTSARARTESERTEATERAFRLASGRPRLLVALTEQAIRNGQTFVWRRGLEELEATGRAELDAAALRRKVLAPPKTVRDPLEAIVRIERMRAAGLHVAADEVLAEALASHPEDPELLALREQSPTSTPGMMQSGGAP